MVISDHLVFIHLQKCGGSFVRTILKEYFGAINVKPNHNGYLDIKPGDKNKLIFGTIRNPYSWYVSLYHKHHNNPNSFFKSTFKNTKNFNEWIKYFLNLKTGRYHDLNFKKISKLNIGPYSYRALMCYGTDRSPKSGKDIEFANIHYIKMEDLNNSLSFFLSKNGLVSGKRRKMIKNHKKIHSGSHKHFSEYYDQDSLDLVFEKDNIIFKKWRYKEC